MARSNVANGANYFDVVFQPVSSTGTTYTWRAVVYLQSLNVIDSSNTFNVTDWGYSRGGSIALNGVYNYVPIWYQDITFNRNLGSDYQISCYAEISGVNYWGVTLAAREYATVPGYSTIPDAPGTSHSSVTATSAFINVTAPNNNGSTITAYETYVLSNNAWPGAGGVVVASWNGGSGTASGLTRATQYFYTSRALNANGWSGWTAMKTFTTLQTTPTVPRTVTVTSVLPDGFTVNWIAPADNGGAAVDDYIVDVSTSSTFATFDRFTLGSTALTKAITGRTPGTAYYVRTFAHNAIGWSPASGTVTVTTLTGLFFKVAGDWKRATLFFKVGGVWKPVNLYKKISGAWKL